MFNKNNSKYRGARMSGLRRGRGSRGRGPRRSKTKTVHPDMYVAKAVQQDAESVHDETKLFADINLIEPLAGNVKAAGYKHPTHIQAQAMPHIFEGRDVLALASTGSGKTAAFLIPMIYKAMKNGSQKCLIITPTRELAQQINDEFIKLARGSNLSSVVVIGGASMGKQIALLRRSPSFVVATPGRLIDLAKQRAINLQNFNNVVLDEVDRMLDMGFIDDIRQIVSRLPEQKQSVFLSATMPKEAEQIAREFLKNPEKVETSKSAPQKNVDQDVVYISSSQNKVQVLHDLLIKEEFHKILIFSRTRRGSDKLGKQLHQKGFKVDVIHGDKSQYVRTKVITRFKKSEINVLVATDVAARGLDIEDISHVINYDEPESYEDYIHRIGRTGRIGKKGKALTFVMS